MSLTAALREFVVVLCWFAATQSEEDWNVIYKETEICENKGSTVFIWSSFDYPAKINNVRTTVEKSFWFFETEGEPVDLREDPKYKDRVTYRRYGNDCNLKISEVRESDSGVYKFRLITNHENRNYTGEPGVRLTVEGVQVQVISRSDQQEYSDLQLKCFNKCDPDVLERYFWFINGEETRSMMWSESSQTFTYKNWTSSTDRISCAVRYYGMSHGMFHRSPEVYAPQTASVSLTPPGEILEGSSVTLTCSSDANPAANFTWFKERNSKVLSVDPQFVFSSIQSTDSGEYYCRAENQLGWKRSDFRVEVKYAPQNISVSVNPPEILEGGSVTLTCSSDANPAANFTWFKENKDSLKSEEQIFTISNFTAEGLYICVAQNQLGQQNSTVQVWVGSGSVGLVAAWSIRAVLLTLMFLAVLFPKVFRRRSSEEPSVIRSQDEDAQEPEGSERDGLTSRRPAEDQVEIQHGSVTFTKRQEDPLYSTVDL